MPLAGVGGIITWNARSIYMKNSKRLFCDIVDFDKTKRVLMGPCVNIYIAIAGRKGTGKDNGYKVLDGANFQLDPACNKAPTISEK